MVDVYSMLEAILRYVIVRILSVEGLAHGCVLRAKRAL